MDGKMGQAGLKFPTRKPAAARPAWPASLAGQNRPARQPFF